jgi:signal transduction histidine kinase/DNA-binding response OmpR family regulator
MNDPALESSPAAAASDNRVNVLIVDDQHDKLLSLETALASLGENIVLARSGRDALRRLLEQDFAVILLDVNMPDMDGFETAALIRQHRRCTHTPIIFVTAFGDDLHTAQGYSLGAVDYILSPIVPDILRTKVRVFVDLFRKTREIERHAEERVNLAREQAARAAAEASNRQLNFLSEASAAMTRHLSTDELVAEINRVAVPFLAHFSAIVLLDDQQQESGKCDAAWVDASGEKHALEQSQWSLLLERLRPAVEQAIQAGALRLEERPLLPSISFSIQPVAIHPSASQPSEASPPVDFQVFGILPLQARGRTIGAMILASARSEPTSLSHLRLVEDFANRASIALDNARLYENVRQHDRRKDQFLAMLGHELRNPLAPIRNAVEILRWEDQDSPEAPASDAHAHSAQARDMIERQVRHMTRLIDDLLDVSRIASGKIRLRKERCDLARLILQTTEDYQSLIEQSGQRLLVDLPEQPVWTQADVVRMSQIVGNLLHNAQKFTDHGGEIAVRLQPDAQGQAALLTIRDTGIGMDQETLHSVFDAFSQADRSLERSRGGLGLGLALVKGLVEMHGGSVQVLSQGVGQGTEFRIQLPLAEQVEPVRPKLPRPPTESRSCRVLIIEDHVDGAESMRMLLRRLGHEVQLAHNGPAGVVLAADWVPDVVLCDIGLPGGMDGYAVARALREEPRLYGVLLIALTGYGRDEDLRLAKEAGFDQHMTKPVDLAVLKQSLTAFTSLCKQN